MSAFIELKGGIILNLNISFIEPLNSSSESGEGKKWKVTVNGSSIQITNDEYNIIKKYYQTQQELY